MRCVVLGIALLAARGADAYVLQLPRTPSVPSSVPREARIHMQQSVLDKAIEENRPEFTDDEISAVLRRTDVRTDGATVEERRVAAMNVLRFERVKNEELALNDRGKQEALRAAWLKSSGTSSWYDAGVRPISEGSARLPVEVDLEPIEKLGKEKLSTSAQASLAVGLLGALAVIGIDIGSVGIVENLDAAVLVGGLAISQLDDEGPVGTTLRAIGNATSGVVEFSGDVASPFARWASKFYVEKEVGYKGRALLEMGLQQALGAANPKRREAERLSTEYETAATVAAELRGQRDALSIWELQARWSLDAEVRDAESTANTAKRAARAAYAALEDE